MKKKRKECKAVLVHTIKAYRGRRGIAPLILNLSTRSEVNLTLWPLYSQERTLVPPWLGGWVGPTAGTNILAGRRMFCFANSFYERHSKLWGFSSAWKDTKQARLKVLTYLFICSLCYYAVRILHHTASYGKVISELNPITGQDRPWGFQ
jgi:hypothetical protein